MKPEIDHRRSPILPAALSDDDRHDIALAARFLTDQGAKSVWLFGSLAKGAPSPRSDFDFAVDGLPGDRLFGSVGHLLQTLSRPVDIVNLEDCPPLLRDQILGNGILLTDEN